MRKFLAIAAGVGTALVLVALIEALGSRVYPPPVGLDPANPEQMAKYVRNLPAGAFLIVLAGWSLATLAGGLVACAIARERPLRYAGIVGAVMLVATVANLAMIPHPVWFSITAVVAIFALTLAASRLATLLPGLSG